MKSESKHPVNYVPILIAALCVALFPNWSHAKHLSGYKGLLNLYAPDLSQTGQNEFKELFLEEENRALNQILKNELNAKLVERQHIFRQSKSTPTKIFKIDEQYTAIGFEKMLNYRGTWEPSTYLLLFETKNDKSFSYTGEYFFWKGKQSVTEYSKVSEVFLCHNFSILAQAKGCQEDSHAQVAQIENKEVANVEKKKIAKLENSETTIAKLENSKTALSQPSKKSNEQNISPPESMDPAVEQKFAEIEKNLHKINTSVLNKADKQHTHSGSDITSGIIKKKFLDSEIDKHHNLASKKSEKEHSNERDDAYVKSLEERIMQLEERYNQVAALLEGVSRANDNIILSGINLQIVNGTGSTNGMVNGTGNLIVGYNYYHDENKNPERTGSHNVIIGDGHEYTSYGGFIAGFSNKVAGTYSSVVGGLHNVANGDYSTVNGGHFKAADGVYSVTLPGTNETKTEQVDASEDKLCFIGSLKRISFEP